MNRQCYQCILDLELFKSKTLKFIVSPCRFEIAEQFETYIMVFFKLIIICYRQVGKKIIEIVEKNIFRKFPRSKKVAV